MAASAVDATATPAVDPEKLLDASTLKPDESLAGRDLSGFTLKGDFSGRNFDDCVLEGVVAPNTNFQKASMQRVKAHGASMQGMDAS